MPKILGVGWGINYISHHYPSCGANGRADALSRRPDYDTGTRDNENVVVIPEHIMVRALEVLGTQPTQDESVLLPWVDPHKLKKVEGVWYKDGRLVVTGGLTDKQTILR